MKDENKRDLYLKVRVSQAEMDAIKRKFQNSGMSTFSGFVRAMIFEGYIVQFSESEQKELVRLAGNIANNVNQIAVRVNSTGKVYEDDLKEIKDGVDRFWQPLMYFQSQLLRLKR